MSEEFLLVPSKISSSMLDAELDFHGITSGYHGQWTCACGYRGHEDDYAKHVYRALIQHNIALFPISLFAAPLTTLGKLADTVMRTTSPTVRDQTSGEGNFNRLLTLHSALSSAYVGVGTAPRYKSPLELLRGMSSALATHRLEHLSLNNASTSFGCACAMEADDDWSFEAHRFRKVLEAGVVFGDTSELNRVTDSIETVHRHISMYHHLPATALEYARLGIDKLREVIALANSQQRR